MKLVFQNTDDGMQLGYVECLSTEEADSFLTWFNRRANGDAKPAAPTPEEVQKAAPQEMPPVAHVVPTGGVPKPTKITRSELSAAAMELMNAKGRGAVQGVLAHFDAKRVSEIPDERMAEAFNRIKESL